MFLYAILKKIFIAQKMSINELMCLDEKSPARHKDRATSTFI